MKGINVELENKIKKLNPTHSEILLPFLKDLSNAGSIIDRNNAKDQFKNRITRYIKESED